jgi:hypothetical protein
MSKYHSRHWTLLIDVCRNHYIPTSTTSNKHEETDKAVITFVVIAIASLIAAVCFHNTEPSYNGRTLSQWYAEYIPNRVYRGTRGALAEMF